MITPQMRAIVLGGARSRTVWFLKCDGMIACLFLVVLLTAGRHARGQGEWDDGFGVPGMNSTVVALTVFDDGTGAALYAGGMFTTAGGVSANSIAKWNGSAWSPLGSGIDDYVAALTAIRFT